MVAGSGRSKDPKTRWDDHADPLSLSEEDLQELIALRKQPPTAESAKREYRRVRVQSALWIPAAIHEPAGSTRLLKVYPVDISAGGMCFLTGMFVHQGSQCSVTLHLPDGELVTVEGKVVRCELLRGRVHEVALRFDQTFDMATLHMASEPPALGAPHAVAAHTTTPAPPAATGTGPVPSALHLLAFGVELKALAEQLQALAQTAARIRAIGVAVEEFAERARKPGGAGGIDVGPDGSVVPARP